MHPASKSEKNSKPATASLRRRQSGRLFSIAALLVVVQVLVSFVINDVADSIPVVPEKQHDQQTTKNPSRKHKRQAEVGRIFGYDEAGVFSIPGTARTHSLPNAIPQSRMIPAAFAENKTYHLSQRTNTSHRSILYPTKKYGDYDWKKHDYTTDFRTLYYYNPSILPLYRNKMKSVKNQDGDPDDLSPRDMSALTGGDDSVKYVVIYHTYLGSNCFGPDPDRALMKTGEQIFYVAVALLDSNLDVIEGTDVLIDINAGPGHGKYFRQFRADCRMSLLRRSIYWLCGEHLHRIQIIRQQNTSSSLNNSRMTEKKQEYGTRNDLRLPYLYPNIYGNGLQIVLHVVQDKIGGGKNFNFFQAPARQREMNDPHSTGPYDYYIQFYPLPHKYRRIYVAEHNESSTRHDQAKFTIYPGRRWESELASTAPVPPNSFHTPDVQNPIRACPLSSGEEMKRPPKITTNCTNPTDIPFWPKTDHGTACCVRMVLNQQPVLVGISHHKLSPRYNFWKRDVYKRYHGFLKDQYVSRFVAYQNHLPFDIVAVSGYFCLGHGSTTSNHSLAGRNRIPLQLFNQTYNCPPIHFPSAFAEYVGDDSKAIIGYGINDCYPRLIVVQKIDIVKRLLGIV